MSDGLVKVSDSQDYVWGSSALFGFQVTGVSAIQWFLMHTNIGKLICYARSFSTIQGICLEGFHCNIHTQWWFDYNRIIELYIVKKLTGTFKVKITVATGFGKICQSQTKIKI